MVDEFKPKARKQYAKTKFYLYKDDGSFIGTFVGKELMSIINNHSWESIRDALRYKQGWFKNFYISEEEITKLPEKPNGNGLKIDIYDKYGNFIETLNSVKAVKEKYNVPASKIKNIQLGDRFFGEYIFKYHKSNK